MTGRGRKASPGGKRKSAQCASPDRGCARADGRKIPEPALALAPRAHACTLPQQLRDMISAQLVYATRQNIGLRETLRDRPTLQSLRPGAAHAPPMRPRALPNSGGRRSPEVAPSLGHQKGLATSWANIWARDLPQLRPNLLLDRPSSAEVGQGQDTCGATPSLVRPNLAPKPICPESAHTWGQQWSAELAQAWQSANTSAAAETCGR